MRDRRAERAIFLENQSWSVAGAISLMSQARAYAQDRFAVRGEILWYWATSSMVIPPKTRSFTSSAACSSTPLNLVVEVCLWAAASKTNIRAKWLMHATVLHLPVLLGLLIYDKFTR